MQGTVGRPRIDPARIDQARGGNTHSRGTPIRTIPVHQRGGFQCSGIRINDRVVPPLPDEDVRQAARQARGDGLSPVQDSGAAARPVTRSVAGSETRPAARNAAEYNAAECRGGRFVASSNARRRRPVRSWATGFAAVGDTERRRLYVPLAPDDIGSELCNGRDEAVGVGWQT